MITIVRFSSNSFVSIGVSATLLLTVKIMREYLKITCNCVCALFYPLNSASQSMKNHMGTNRKLSLFNSTSSVSVYCCLQLVQSYKQVIQLRLVRCQDDVLSILDDSSCRIIDEFM